MKKLLIIYFFLILSSNSHTEEFKFEKIASLAKPWGSSFINESELIITEKIGNIKIVKI